MRELKLLNIIVENNFGVLARIASLFGRKGYNIDSLTVSNTNIKEISRITITLTADNDELDHIVSQILKLEEVIDVNKIPLSKAIMREIMIVKLKVDNQTRGNIKEIAEIYGAEIIDLSPASIIIELTGRPEKITALLEILESFEIIEVSRTGITAMQRR